MIISGSLFSAALRLTIIANTAEIQRNSSRVFVSPPKFLTLFLDDNDIIDFRRSLGSLLANRSTAGRAPYAKLKS